MSALPQKRTFVRRVEKTKAKWPAIGKNGIWTYPTPPSPSFENAKRDPFCVRNFL
jgi:hypothetical protein